MQHLGQVRDHQRDIESTGAKILAVSFGSPREVQEYREYFSVSVTIASDLDRSTYRAFGLGQGSLTAVYGPAAIRQHLRLRKQGFAAAPSSPSQDTLQLGGDFVIDREGRIVFAHRGTSGDDRPPVEALVAACRKIAP